MSYKDKIQNYQADCGVILGKYKRFSQYIVDFSKTVAGYGLDLGTGPGGQNAKFFSSVSVLHGCDAEPEVIKSLSDLDYSKKFRYFLGSDEVLPYENNYLDFIICSCVIQHLNSFEELSKGLEEIYRCLKRRGKFYLMFKAGTNDSLLTHFNDYYKQERTFRVFHPDKVLELAQHLGFSLETREELLDDNWIPYCCMIFIK